MSIPFESGVGGYAAYRIPALTVTPAGTVLALAEGRVNSAADSGDIDIVGRRSLDGGQTWQAQTVVAQASTNTIGNPTMVVDPASGDLVLLSSYNRGEDTSAEIRAGSAPARRVFVQRSSDDGVTWTSPAEITDQVRESWMRWYATGPGTGIVTSSGRLVVPANHSRAPAAGSTDDGTEAAYYGAHCILSDDGGHTWRIGFESSTPHGDMNENESTVAELADGRLYFNCRNEQGTLPGTRGDAYSPDGGETLTLSYRPQASIVTPVVQGHVIAVGDVLLYSGPADPTDRAAMAIRISRDQGATWDVAYRVSGLAAGYSCLTLLDSQTVGLLYETADWALYKRIEFVSVPLADLGL